MTPRTEKLDSYLSSYTSFNDWLIRRRYQKLSEYFSGTSCLEMGCSEGSGTKYLIDKFAEVVSVDGSPEAIATVSKRYPVSGFSAVCSFFEEMNFGERRFDCIILAHILEHVDDPIKVLSQAKKYAAPGGVIIIDVPNGNSLHRQVGVNMGLLTELTQLNDADLSIGHQRVYMPDTFKADILSSGLKVKQFGGMFIKVLSNAQTEKVFNPQQLEALFAVGERNPEIAAEIFVVAGL
jgi:2-polyprenyl-3-methyl-5-hydroxy-6-metoxy-1,4-benzoquinol methylase